MNDDALESIRANARTDYPPSLCAAIRAASEYFNEYLFYAPILKKLRLQSIYTLRQMGWTIPEIAAETGVDEDRITELLKLDRRRRKRDDIGEGGAEDPE